MAGFDHSPKECPECGKVCAGPGPLTMHMRARHKAAPKSPAVPVPEGPAPDPVDGAAGPLYSSDERRPTEGKEVKPSISSRLFGGKTSAGAPSVGPPATSERRPAAPSKRRVSTSDTWGDAVGGISTLVAQAGYVPMSRAMNWSSPVAGEIIEDATKGTIVDRLIQPVARNGEKWQDLFDLLGLWAAVGVAQSNPAQAPQALMFARKRFVSLLPRIASNIRKQREKEKAAVEAVAELMPDIADLFPGGKIPEGEDPIDALIMALFAPPVGAEPMAEPVPV